MFPKIPHDQRTIIPWSSYPMLTGIVLATIAAGAALFFRVLDPVRGLGVSVIEGAATVLIFSLLINASISCAQAVFTARYSLRASPLAKAVSYAMFLITNTGLTILLLRTVNELIIKLEHTDDLEQLVSELMTPSTKIIVIFMLVFATFAVNNLMSIGGTVYEHLVIRKRSKTEHPTTALARGHSDTLKSSTLDQKRK